MVILSIAFDRFFLFINLVCVGINVYTGNWPLMTFHVFLAGFFWYRTLQKWNLIFKAMEKRDK